MNRRQKVILIESIAVVVITFVAVVAMINAKDWVNRSEAMRAMEQLGERALDYRKAHGFVPPESYVTNVRESLEGHLRLGHVQYRGLWIDFESTPDEILAYCEKRYPSSLFDDGYVVLRLSGKVEWLGKQEFETELAHQQSEKEIEMLQK
ncbi:MAG: hypothetical protein ACYSX1_02820 [Planctomycetota bacterium]|jgi:radical SAM superfamily enzyme YgiQ (UPF0313 family)